MATKTTKKKKMILTLKPKPAEQKIIEKLRQYTGEKTATKTIMYAVLRYQKLLEDNERFLNDIDQCKNKIQHLKDSISNLLSIEDNKKEQIKDLRTLISDNR